MRITLLLLALLAAGCVRRINPYEHWYAPSPHSPRPDSAISPRDLQVLNGTDPDQDISRLLKRGYAIIGMSAFNGVTTTVTDDQLRKQAIKVGAQLVVLWTVPTDTTGKQFNRRSTPRSRATVGTVFGRSDFGAMYFVRHADPVGLYFVEVDDETQADLHAPFAQLTTLVVDGSPAAVADIRAGDVIMQIDGRPIDKDFDYARLVEARRGKQIVFTIDRDGIRLRRVVDVRP